LTRTSWGGGSKVAFNGGEEGGKGIKTAANKRVVERWLGLPLANGTSACDGARWLIGVALAMREKETAVSKK